MSPLTGILALLYLCAGIGAQDSSSEGDCEFDFGYSGENGPATWGEHCPQCNGKNQSPINVDTSQAEVLDFPPLVGSFIEKSNEDYSFRISNDGYTVTVYPQTEQPLTIQGGPLDGIYTLTKLQFCWGSNDSVGSEHTFNGERFPLEAVWVFEKNGEDGEPQNQMWISQLFRLSDERNPALSVIAGQLDRVSEPGSEVESSEPLSYDSILSGFPPDDFYTYTGSLTTPPCTEGVKWLGFPPGLPGHQVTEDVLAALRSLKSADGSALVNNFRPPQPLNGRRVMQSTKSSQILRSNGHYHRGHGRGASHGAHQSRARGPAAARHRVARRHH